MGMVLASRPGIFVRRRAFDRLLFLYLLFGWCVSAYARSISPSVSLQKLARA